MCSTSVYNARNNLSSLIKQVQAGEVVQITNHNKVVAYIVSADEYEDRKDSNDFFSWLEKWRAEAMPYLDDKGLDLPPREYEDTRKLDDLFGGSDE